MCFILAETGQAQMVGARRTIYIFRHKMDGYLHLEDKMIYVDVFILFSRHE